MSPTQQAGSGLLSFGQRYAVLNVDWMAILIDAVKDAPEGEAFISSCSRWNDAVHKKNPRPLTLFTSLFFLNPSQPELAKHDKAPFARLLQSHGGTFENESAGVQIHSRFAVDDEDIVLQKTRWYAGAGNALEQILKARDIDTIIISGLSFSGAVMSTIYRLFDLDYTVCVISDNVVDLPVSDNAEVSRVILDTLLPKMHLKVMSIEEALEALERS